jgi:hypothetical protein
VSVAEGVLDSAEKFACADLSLVEEVGAFKKEDESEDAQEEERPDERTCGGENGKFLEWFHVDKEAVVICLCGRRPDIIRAEKAWRLA